MTMEETTTADALETGGTLELTEGACAKIRSLQDAHPEAEGLRVAVRGGGCNGLEYHFAMDSRDRKSVV